MVYGRERELGKMIGEMGNKIMERLNEELGKLKIWQREREWREDKREMGLKIESLEERVLELETRVGGGVKDERQWRRRELEGTRDWMRLVDKMKGIGRKLELKEREESRNNIVIRRLEGREGETRGKEEKVLEEIGANVEIE